MLMRRIAEVRRNRNLKTTQSDTSVAKNISFFRDNRDSYDRMVQQLDTYVAMHHSLNNALRGINRLLDIGNGGVFDYDTSIIPSIVALDLFFDDLPASFSCPANVTLNTGSALSIPEPNDSFDGVLVAMLIHHLVGTTVKESVANVHRAIGEAFRVLQPGGRLIILESCVPRWFYGLERAVFPIAAPLINAILAHPATLQYPASLLARMMTQYTTNLEVCRIPKGRYILQFGYKIPSVLTPTNPYRFIAHKRS
jgi:SAM-dependent methyltransferase